MKSLLHTLQDNESILLMYLFDELPPDDRTEVEWLLRTDGNLRNELAHLRAAHEVLQGALSIDPTPTHGHETAAFEAKRQIDRWNVKRLLTLPAPVQRSRAKAWLVYGGGVAAALLLGYLVYWGNFSKTSGEGSVGRFASGLTIDQQQAWAAAEKLGDAGFSTDSPILIARSDDESDRLRKSLDVTEDLLNDSLKHPYLNDAEQEIQRARELSQGDPEEDFGQVISQ